MRTNDVVVAGRAPARHTGPRRSLRRAGVLGVSVLLAVASLAASNPPAASATTYPTWADVVAARNSEAATKAAVAKIQGDLADLNGQLTTANADALAAGEAATAAENKYALAQDKEQTLQQQEATAAAKAAKSKQQLGAYASQLARGPSGGGGWSTMSLLLNGKSEGQLLNGLGAIGQISKEENALLQEAVSQQNSVKQLEDLATAQAQILDQQKQAADAAKAAAAAAAAKLQAAVTAAATYQQQLTVQLAALTTNANMTETQYEAGVAAAQGAGQAVWWMPRAGRCRPLA
ncbi:MAG: hypothetical protein WDM88_10355 [Galbitalea sp.]